VVRAAYQLVLRRDASTEDVRFWADALDAGMSGEALLLTFARSDEFRILHEPRSDGDFVDFIYATLLERAAEPEGRAYWLDALWRGTSRGDVAGFFIDGAEFESLPSHALFYP